MKPKSRIQSLRAGFEVVPQRPGPFGSRNALVQRRTRAKKKA